MFMLWLTTIYGPSRTSAKPISLGYIPSCFSYIEAPKTSKTQDFDAKIQAIDTKTSGNNLTTLSFVLFFQEHKSHNTLNMMLDPCFKG